MVLQCGSLGSNDVGTGSNCCVSLHEVVLVTAFSAPSHLGLKVNTFIAFLKESSLTTNLRPLAREEATFWNMLSWRYTCWGSPGTASNSRSLLCK